jgi:hypothetical protein
MEEIDKSAKEKREIKNLEEQKNKMISKIQNNFIGEKNKFLNSYEDFKKGKISDKQLIT